MPLIYWNTIILLSSIFFLCFDFFIVFFLMSCQILMLISLKASDSMLSKAYWLSKVHKKGIPFRIIVSSTINFTCYSFANYLHKYLLRKSLSLPKSHVKNSFQLHKILQDLKIPRNHVLICLWMLSFCSLIFRLNWW